MQKREYFNSKKKTDNYDSVSNKYGKSLQHLSEEDVKYLNKEVTENAKLSGEEDWRENLYLEKSTSRVFLYLPGKSSGEELILKDIGKDKKLSSSIERGKRKTQSLSTIAKTASAFATISGFSMLLATSTEITGNVVRTIPPENLAITGTILFAVGLFGLWMNFKKPVRE